VRAADLALGITWICTITADDGETTGDPGEDIFIP
jgi:hypothetical protein